MRSSYSTTAGRESEGFTRQELEASSRKEEREEKVAERWTRDARQSDLHADDGVGSIEMRTGRGGSGVLAI